MTPEQEMARNDFAALCFILWLLALAYIGVSIAVAVNYLGYAHGQQKKGDSIDFMLVVIFWPFIALLRLVYYILTYLDEFLSWH